MQFLSITIVSNTLCASAVPPPPSSNTMFSSFMVLHNTKWKHNLQEKLLWIKTELFQQPPVVITWTNRNQLQVTCTKPKLHNTQTLLSDNIPYWSAVFCSWSGAFCIKILCTLKDARYHSKFDSPIYCSTMKSWNVTLNTDLWYLLCGRAEYAPTTSGTDTKRGPLCRETND